MTFELLQDVWQTQDQIHDLIINRHVPRANGQGKDNVVMIIEENTTTKEDGVYKNPSCIARIQSRFITKKGRCFKA